MPGGGVRTHGCRGRSLRAAACHPAAPRQARTATPWPAGASPGRSHRGRSGIHRSARWGPTPSGGGVLLKKGVCLVTVPGASLEERLAAARDAGYQGVEPSLGRPGQGPLALDAPREAVQAVRDAARARGLEIPSVMGAGAYVIHPDPTERTQAIQNLRRALQVAAWLGARDVLLHPGQLQPSMRYDWAFDALLSALRDLKPEAEALGVGIAVENVWNKFLLSPREARELVDAVGSPLIGVYFDVGNYVPWAYPAQWIRILGRRIRKVHVKDFQRRVGTIEGFCQLLDGDADYPEVMRALRDRLRRLPHV